MTNRVTFTSNSVNIDLIYFLLQNCHHVTPPVSSQSDENIAWRGCNVNKRYTFPELTRGMVKYSFVRNEEKAISSFIFIKKGE